LCDDVTLISDLCLRKIKLIIFVIENPSKLTDEIVKTNYEKIVKNGLLFLQVFPQMFQENTKTST
jgi:hypothetical protein